MPTPKQTREAYRKIIIYTRKLHAALCDAHRKGIIEYSDGKYQEEGPCYSLSQVRDRIDMTTEKALLNAIRTEIKSKIPYY